MSHDISLHIDLAVLHVIGSSWDVNEENNDKDD